MSVAIWTLLIILAVYDLRENRIPNNILVLLLLVVFLNLVTVNGGITSIPLSHVWGLLTGFSIGFILYLIGAMSAGDVKLIAVLSFLVAVDNVGQLYINIVLVGAIVSSFYVLLAVARSSQGFHSLTRNYIASNVYGRLQRSAVIKPMIFQVPFAPSIVLAYLVLN
ncbi:prepilin peptidase [Vibrio hangzhouensis]|uniref:Prepilin peptidase CpaA n=1 Tax=Vibrio hangzhouensis TaxID=462991 RepID=A0A1H5YL95_9VIBR|nr:A24 family peptidase [Vibrio hangzhouensis]SEG24500.1 prepilin peptidase CpaA [Vibrio hangzhouensis]